ncbi:hypothetical protein GCM10011385_08110 [Nitratireductor aestuarii]|uniref:Uncharacterized protein n=1 Tax=Nitratireductor aestuarii TaxID=1735103 RepID=A0A916W0R7_9HYPH|nr:hypothetical protein GCM10011385_08110 [Nitratireductor aestuarii]
MHHGKASAQGKAQAGKEVRPHNRKARPAQAGGCSAEEYGRKVCPSKVTDQKSWHDDFCAGYEKAETRSYAASRRFSEGLD